MILLGLGISLLYMNAITKSIMEYTGSIVTGADTSVDGVDIRMFSARSSFSPLVISSPPPFEGPFLRLDTIVCDLNFWSMLAPAFRVQELTVSGIHVWIKQQITGNSNAVTVLANVMDYKEDHDPRIKRKFFVDRLELENIDAVVDVAAVSAVSRPITWKVPKVVVTDIGKKRDGVTLGQLFEVVLHAVLVAVMVGAPDNVEENVLKGICASFKKAVDIGEIHLDLGHGLTRMGRVVGALTNTIGNTTEAAGDVAAVATVGITEVIGDHLPGKLGKIEKMTGKAVAGIIDTSTDFSGRITKRIGQMMSGAMGGCANWIVSNTLNPDKDAVTV